MVGGAANKSFCQNILHQSSLATTVTAATTTATTQSSITKLIMGLISTNDVTPASNLHLQYEHLLVVQLMTRLPRDQTVVGSIPIAASHLTFVLYRNAKKS